MVYTISGDHMNYQTKDLAKLAGISIRTLRYYDQIGLLTPHERTESNYRVYHDEDVNQLQQILFFKEMGLELNQIKVLMRNLNSEKRLRILESHLSTLQEDMNRKKMLIDNVNRTIQSLKGEITMTNQEKFEGLKKDVLKKNDELYQDEVIDTWGESAYKASINAFKEMTEEQFHSFQNLATQIIETLQEIKKHDVLSLRMKVARLHQSWIQTAWGNQYSKQAHLGVVDMYVLDDRFKAYYDQHGEGLAEILRDSVHQYLNHE